MIINERKLLGIFPYTAVFFPTREAIDELPRKLGPIAAARFFWTAVEITEPAHVVQREDTATVCIDLRRTSDSLWQAIAKNNRNEIRSAERLNSRVRLVREESDARRHFIELYRAFARAKSRIAPYSHDMLKRYGENAEVFVAYLDDQPMCGHVYLKDVEQGRARLLYSASRRLENRQTSRLCGNLNRLLHWHAIYTYQADRFACYDLGGIREDPNDGIARFKCSFGGTIVKEHTYLCAGSFWVGAAARVILRRLRGNASRWSTELPAPTLLQTHDSDAWSDLARR